MSDQHTKYPTYKHKDRAEMMAFTQGYLMSACIRHSNPDVYKAYHGDTTQDAYVRVQGDVSFPKGGHGMLPQYTYLWIQKGKGATNLIGKIEDLEQKNSLLTDNLDLDFIEILIREKFLFGKPGETTYIIKKDGKQN